MKIYLYLENKILNFYLPKDVSGSFSFDEDEKETSKLINVNAKDKKWILYSTEEVKVLNGNTEIREIEIKPGQFHMLKRNDKVHLIYIVETNELNSGVFQYNNNSKMIYTGSNNGSDTVIIRGPFSNYYSFEISYQQNMNSLVLNIQKGKFYINKIGVSGNTAVIKNGDELELYGIRILFTCNYIIIYSKNNILTINSINSGITTSMIKNKDQIQNIVIKDKDLYKEEDYFTKSPRIRRTIQEKDIELSAPPSAQQNEQMPAILTMGPMMTMGLTSAVTLYSSLSGILNGTTDVSSQAGTLVMGVSMLVSTLLWPVITNIYNKRVQKKKQKELKIKYFGYLDTKRKELEAERILQKEIITENIIPIDECLKNITNGKLNFWDKRNDQSDFLVVRVGIGNEKLKAKVSYPPEGFSIDEDDLKKEVDKLKEDFTYIENVPIGYSLYENNVTAVMGNIEKANYFINNILLQLLSFYSYDDLKIVVFTNPKNEKNWDYLKYTKHNMSNDNTIRYFASTEDTAQVVVQAIGEELNKRIEQLKDHKSEDGQIFYKPYFLMIVDDLDIVKKTKIIEMITEIRINLGVSILILESKLSKLPSLCNNFINIEGKSSHILKNSYEKQEQQIFTDEINYKIDMMNIVRKIANIPIEISSGDENSQNLPDAINFLEMENVGKVEQLNVLNRWNTNDSTANLKAEVGVGPDGKFMYLDLHEKAHGPHGLVAGMTGSGKSEFIITWILSLCMNFSPEDVAFILIDYKGGGLAFAFENEKQRLPHLTGTITNLDKAEIARTLVSIDSEVKRRQKVFNEAREKLGESTIDIYKYQRNFHDGKLDEPLPHLFIVCDEFAELKAQQPEFMDNLISVARIGRSLGVHLILATQKPSGVVNDQIWSNTKFRVCLKVQDASDSKEMLKRPDAASLKQTGRFYLQVGYDEYFALGQSGWCGAKYYPSDIVKKTVDKSINIIDETGQIIKTIQASSGPTQQKVEAQGEQLAAILDEIIKTATESNKFAKRLWLENIPAIITIDKTIEKYQLQKTPYEYNLLIGEYDAPELQEQKPLIYNILKDGNATIFGTDSQESEEVVNAMLYNIIKFYKTEELTYYIFDFGSQNFVKFRKTPHCGGVVTPGDNEAYLNLIKLIQAELKERKKILSEFGGEYIEYVKQNPGKMPVMFIVINNYESIFETYDTIYDTLCEIVRDSERYGVVFVVTASTITAIPDKAKQLMPFGLGLKLKDPSDYQVMFNSRQKIEPRDIFGRGICKNEILHEFQTAYVCEDRTMETTFLLDLFKEIETTNQPQAKLIPTLPEQVKLDNIRSKLKGVSSIPVGIEKGTLAIKKFNMSTDIIKQVVALKLKYVKSFVKSFICETILLKLNVTIFDPFKELSVFNGKINNYIDSNFEEVVDKLTEELNNDKNTERMIIFYSADKLINSLEDSSKFDKLIESMKKNEHAYGIIADESNKLKDRMYDTWYKYVDKSEGIYIGKGVDEQSVIKISAYGKELTAERPKNYGVYANEGSFNIIKLIEFEREKEDDEDE